MTSTPPHLKGRKSSLVRGWRKSFVEPCPAVGARRTALKAKASMCQGHRREVFDCEDYGKSQSTKVLSAISTECAGPFSKIGSVARRNYLNAIIAILIAHIIKRTAPIAIAIFIVSSSLLAIAVPYSWVQKTRSPATSGYLVTGEAWRGRAKAGALRRVFSYPSLMRARKFSPTLSRKPVVESQRWSAPTRRARSLVM